MAVRQDGGHLGGGARFESDPTMTLILPHPVSARYDADEEWAVGTAAEINSRGVARSPVVHLQLMWVGHNPGVSKNVLESAQVVL